MVTKPSTESRRAWARPTDDRPPPIDRRLAGRGRPEGDAEPVEDLRGLPLPARAFRTPRFRRRR